MYGSTLCQTFSAFFSDDNEISLVTSSWSKNYPHFTAEIEIEIEDRIFRNVYKQKRTGKFHGRFA